MYIYIYIISRYIIKVQNLIRDDQDGVPRRWKSEMQDGGHDTCTTHACKPNVSNLSAQS